MTFNPTNDPRYVVFFSKCIAELHATKWDELAKFDKLARLDRLIWAARAPENVISNFSPIERSGNYDKDQADDYHVTS